jgi:bacteriocin biosynthesis cyclodehydratase domain-containing protein
VRDEAEHGGVNPLPALPYLAPWYRVAVDRGRVVLEYGQRIVCLEGGAAERLVPALLPLLDGSRAVDEIVAVLGEVSRPAVEHVLAQLAEQNLLVEGPALPDSIPRPVAGAAELLVSLRPGPQPLGDTAAQVAACSIGVVGRGTAGLEAARLLRLSGVDVEWLERIESGVDLAVGAPAPGELPRLREWNEQALEAAQPWLQILPFDGRYGTVGPLYLPGDTGCYECFRRRRAANLGAFEEVELLEPVPGGYPSAPALDAVLGGVAAQVALHWLVLGDHYAPACFYALEPLPAFTLTGHHLHRVPRCHACSGLEDVAAPLPWYKEVPVAGGA